MKLYVFWDVSKIHGIEELHGTNKTFECETSILHLPVKKS